MRITFVLPGAGNLPVGGFKVVYEYANRLVRRGHSVAVVHPAVTEKAPSLRERGRAFGRYLLRRVGRNFDPGSWFRLDQRVRSSWVPSLDPRHLPDGDVIVATAWQTAEWVSEYAPAKGEPFYLIQGLETWSGSAEQVLNTWRLPLRKITISRWLHDIATSIGEEAEYIPNGLDFESFGMDVEPAARKPSTILMLYHAAQWKGTDDGLAAIARVKERLSDLEASLFGVPPAPQDCPKWIRYYRRPAQPLLRSLYNRAAVFVSPSHTEGWGLTASESLVCGCALAATDAGGHREFALHEETALVSPTADSGALAGNIERLLHDHELRIRLALAGHKHIQQFTWDRAIEKFERAVFSKRPNALTSPASSSSVKSMYGA